MTPERERKILSSWLRRKRSGSRRLLIRIWSHGVAWLVLVAGFAVAFGLLKPVTAYDIAAIVLGCLAGFGGGLFWLIRESDRELDVIVGHLDEGSIQRRLDEIG